jgi:WD40 repeat protein
VKADYKPIDLLSEQVLHNDRVTCVQWSETDLILSGSFDHTIKLFDVPKKTEKSAFNLKDSVCTALDKRNNTILSGLENGLIKYFF